jgi:hypothetical protein
MPYCSFRAAFIEKDYEILLQHLVVLGPETIFFPEDPGTGKEGLMWPRAVGMTSQQTKKRG